MLGKHVKTVFKLWVIVFALVGAQMGWVLRPFIGNPNLPFTWFRGRESNFFQAVLHTFQTCSPDETARGRRHESPDRPVPARR